MERHRASPSRRYGDKRGREGGGVRRHYKFAAILKEALSPSGSEQIVIRQSTYIRWFFFSGIKTACTFVTTR